MSNEVKSELYFLIAKFLKKQFPEFGEIFIKECESRNLFPSRVFTQSPTFDQLDEKALTGIPDDQLLNIISLACPKSQFPSLFFSEKKLTGNPQMADLLIYNVGRPVAPLKGFCATGRVVGHFDKIFCLALDMTSQILITGSDDGLIKLWKTPQLILMSTIQAHEREVTDITVHPNNKYFVSTSYDQTMNLINIQTCQKLKTYRFNGLVHTARFSPCGKYLAAALDEGICRLYTFEDEELIEYLDVNVPQGNSPSWVTFSPGSSFLAFCAEPDIVIVINIAAKQAVELIGHRKEPNFVYFSKTDPNKLMSLSRQDKKMYVWRNNDDLWGSYTSYSTRTPKNVKVNLVGCAWNADDSRVIGISSNYIYCWDAHSRKLISFSNDPVYSDHCTVLAANPVFPEIVFVGTNSGYSGIWDIEAGRLLEGFEVTEGGCVNDVCWTADGTTAFAADSCGGVTYFQWRHSPICPTTQMFFSKDLIPDDGIEDHPEVPNADTIVDVNFIPLDPQPRRWRPDMLKLDTKPAPLHPAAARAEQKLLDTWRSHGSIHPRHKYTKEGSSSDETERIVYDINRDTDAAILRARRKRDLEESAETVDDDELMPTQEAGETSDDDESADVESDVVPTAPLRMRSRSHTEAPTIAERALEQGRRSSHRRQFSPPQRTTRTSGQPQVRRSPRRSPVQDLFDEDTEQADEEIEEEEEEQTDEENEEEDEEEEGESSDGSGDDEDEEEENEEEDEEIEEEEEEEEEETLAQDMIANARTRFEERRIRELLDKSKKESVKGKPKSNTKAKPVSKPKAATTAKKKTETKTETRKSSREHKPARTDSPPQSLPKPKTKLKQPPKEVAKTTSPVRQSPRLHHVPAPDPFELSSPFSSPKRRQNNVLKREEESTDDKETELESSSESEGGAIIPKQPSQHTERAVPAPPWLSWSDPSSTPYYPQRGEEVVFSKKLYQKYLSDMGRTARSQPIGKEIPKLAIARVDNVTVTQRGLNLKLRFKEVIPHQTHEIFYPMPAAPGFIISRTIFDESIRHAAKLQCGDEISCKVNLRGREVVDGVVEYVSNEVREKPIDSITVAVGSRNISISPWQIEYRRSRSKLSRTIDHLLPRLRKLIKSNKALSKCHQGPAANAAFHAGVRPVSLDLILDRIDHGWYLNQLQVVEDINGLEAMAPYIECSERKVRDCARALIAYLSEELDRACMWVPPEIADPPRRRR